MNARSPSMGNTLSEYALLAGLVLMVALGSIKLLGNSTQGLLQNTDKSLANDARSLVSLDFGNGKQGKAGGGSGSGLPGNENDSALPNPAFATNVNLAITEGNSSGLNATAAEGATNKIEAVYQNARYALQMEENLSPSMEPSLYEWASAITRNSKLAAGAEGVLNDMSEFAIGETNTALAPGMQINPDSLNNNLIDYQANLMELINNPPPGANSKEVQFYSKLGTNVATNINQQTGGKTEKVNTGNVNGTLALTDFSQYMNDAQLNSAIHKTAASGEAKQISDSLDTVMVNSDTMNQRQ